MNTKAKPDPYDSLIEAICIQARKDLYARTKDGKPNKKLRMDARKFFLSEWFFMLTELDGKSILDKLESQKAKK